ncbi:MAG: ABC transporter ATP-binding protein [Methanomicrobiaceae archaeon]|nr:ABC transporter ATP-binding protein [Methanomicrobiaceae archaeon]
MIKFDHMIYREIQVPELNIPEGLCSVFGPNGSGKSTLLRLIAGIDQPDEGTILINGNSPRNTECGYLSEFPDRNIVFERVADEISSPLKFRHLDCNETEEKVRGIIQEIGITGLYDKNVTRLSGGEKILVALATAISIKPGLLVIDEADSHLDSQTASGVFEIIRRLEIPHVVFCTQDMNRVEEIADFAVYMENGRVAESGEPSSVFETLGETCFSPGNTES